MSIKFNTILGILLALLLGLLANRYFFSSAERINGERAPGFSAELMNGEHFELEDMKGHYVLLDFWGSWCAPCRRANPELVALYQKYRDIRFKEAAGFRIVSIGIERDESSWREAIEQDQLNWPYHILDAAPGTKWTGGSIAEKYGIEAVPTSYLLDGKGVIIGVDLSAKEIDLLLDQKN